MRDWQIHWEETNVTVGGGQGKIIKVINKQTKALGALKVLHNESIEDSERRNRMAREVLALEKLNGLGVPKVLEHNISKVEEKGSELYFISEWIDGKTLTRYVNGKAQSIDHSIQIFQQLIQTIGICHNMDIIHRDIKPDNIMISNTNKDIILVDFGIAWCSKDIPEQDMLTEAGQELGNRFFRIPDLMAGRQKRDCRSDITQAIGVLFFLLTGRAPRILIDENLLSPHKAMADAIPITTTSDNRWSLIERIFEVGFQPSIDLRFQNTNEVLQSIKKIINYSSEEKRVDTTSTQQVIDELNTLMSNAKTASWMRIENAMLQSSRALESKMKDMADRNGLQSIHFAGGARVSIAGEKVEFSYTLTRRDFRMPEVEINNTLELIGDNKSYVQASFTVNGNSVPTYYYYGLAADIGAMHDGMLNYAESMFNLAVRLLISALKKSSMEKSK